MPFIGIEDHVIDLTGFGGGDVGMDCICLKAQGLSGREIDGLSGNLKSQ